MDGLMDTVDLASLPEWVFEMVIKSGIESLCLFKFVWQLETHSFSHFDMIDNPLVQFFNVDITRN